MAPAPACFGGCGNKELAQNALKSPFLTNYTQHHSVVLYLAPYQWNPMSSEHLLCCLLLFTRVQLCRVSVKDVD